MGAGAGGGGGAGGGTKPAAGVGGNAGAVKVLLHAGHFAICPAKASGKVSFL
jgi:hypothetical protein